MTTKLYEDNVKVFIDKCCKEIGDWEAEQFDISTWCVITNKNNPIESPIEKILYSAIRFIAQINYIEKPDVISIGGEEIPIGLHINPQYTIDKYRVDFLLCYGKNITKEKHEERHLIVECDSQIFHERDEKQRRYEKARDRYLITKGYKTFHYTGTEICKTPFKIAVEILSYLTDTEMSEFIIDSTYAGYED